MSYAHARSRLEIYKNQPRSITEYEPGFSSIAFKEAKTVSSIYADKWLYIKLIEVFAAVIFIMDD